MVALICVTCMALAVSAKAPQDEAAPTQESQRFKRVEAEEFVVLREGREVARLGRHSSHESPGLFIRGKRGIEQIELFVEGETPDLSFMGGDGTLRLWAVAPHGGPLDGSVGLGFYEKGATIGSIGGGGELNPGRMRYKALTEEGWWTSP